jgi:hypothetical protein
LVIPYFTGLKVTEEQLKEAATQSGILQAPDDYLEPHVRAECERLIPDHDTIKPSECQYAYLYLKQHYSTGS